MTASAQPASEVVGARVKKLRKERGWTVRQMVEECRALGWEITSAQVENIEGVRREGRGATRRVSVDEVITLAWALGVAPIALLFPDDAEQSYAITPEISVEAERAYRWAVGALAPPLVIRNANEHPGEHASRVARYLTVRPGYMPADLNPPDPAIVERLQAIEDAIVKRMPDPSADRQAGESRDEQ